MFDNFISVSNTGDPETMKDIENILKTYIEPFNVKDGKPKTEKLNVNIIKDKELQQKYVKSAVANPIVVIFEKNVKSKRELRVLTNLH